MKTTRTLENGILKVSIKGKLDAATVPAFKDEIQSELKNADKLIIDMKELTYISSAGLRFLLSLHKKLRKKGGLTITNINAQNMEIFEFTGFTDILNIE